MPEYFNIGKIVATHGLLGEVVLVHNTAQGDALGGLKTLFVEERTNSFIPYFIEDIRTKNDRELYVKFEDISSKESAGKLLRKQVYLEEKYFRQIVKNNSILYYLGFEVIDAQAGDLGPVAEVLEMPSQLLMKVYQGEKELLIPINEQTLQNIDEEKKVIRVNLPDGLLDIYH